MSNNPKTYTYDELVKLKNDIEKIKNKKILSDIKDIILSINPDISITKNANGIYLCFNDLIPDTYSKLFDIIKKVKNNLNDGLTNESDGVNYSTTEFPFEGNSKLKYSNKEKNLIKRKLYEQELKIQNSIEDIESSIFIKNKKN
jgi:hypothetical protein